MNHCTRPRKLSRLGVVFWSAVVGFLMGGAAALIAELIEAVSR